jgi:hypothetical protein
LRCQGLAFDVEAHGPRIAEYCRAIEQAFGSNWLMRPPLTAVPEGESTSVLDMSVRLAAERFGVSIARLRWSYTSEPTHPRAAGCVIGPATHRIEMRDGVAVIRFQAPEHDVWRVEVADRYRSDAEVTLVIVAHEVAHVALFDRRVGRTSAKENEELTDAAAALAGFAPVMTRVARREHVWRSGKKIYMTLGAAGYLKAGALEYLALAQRERTSLRQAAAENESSERVT